MAIDTDGFPVNGFGTEVTSGNVRSIVTDAATYLLHTGQCKLAKVIVWAVGTGWTLDFYDEVSGAGSQVFKWVTASGVGAFDLQIPCKTGLTVVSGGTAGGATIVWS